MLVVVDVDRNVMCRSGATVGGSIPFPPQPYGGGRSGDRGTLSILHERSVTECRLASGSYADEAFVAKRQLPEGGRSLHRSRYF